VFKPAALTASCLLAAAGCATLPDTEALSQRRAAQSVSFANARGPVSAQKSAAILAELKRKSPDLDILEKHVALEQAIVASPLTLGNKVTLLQDGAATYPAMFAAIRNARDHINLETYIFEDDEAGRQFSDLLLESQARGVQVNVIYDSVGGFSTPKAFFERLTRGGIEVLEFNPLNPLAAKKPWPDARWWPATRSCCCRTARPPTRRCSPRSATRGTTSTSRPTSSKRTRSAGASPTRSSPSSAPACR